MDCKWQSDVRAGVREFWLSGCPLSYNELIFQFLPAPHEPPGLPGGHMGIYVFYYRECCLKVGMAGPNSGTRFQYQHYNGCASSTLAGSLCRDFTLHREVHLDLERPGNWIKATTHRANVLLPSRWGTDILRALETFLIARLRPRYERSLTSGVRQPTQSLDLPRLRWDVGAD